jgi:transcription initiation factor TFIID subunit 1, fungi type
MCLYESAMAGEQRLKDIGYATLDFGEGDGNEEDENTTTDLEVQMAPWTTTKNFVFATQV